ncbi:hypothetical protein Bca52824_003883 [Brassica carinata]|uniref:Uncharacterized protein n=1 Tax=Brassica carinata TaxID=52824 RepID=A0A8X7WKU5_BRACI|nr:hypothetical protein Bca52824_003883 [Brassica carinata]
MEKKVALVLSLMLLMSMNSVLVSAEEAAPTVGQRVDTATNDVTNFFNKHAGPAADTVSLPPNPSTTGLVIKLSMEWGL